MVPKEQEDYNRDLERAEEYDQTTARASVLGKNKIELSTGLIIAARYADKLRRVALVAFSKIAPKDVIIRDVSELNKQLYDKIVNEMKLDKLDVIRIMVDAEYDENENKLKFENLRIIRYYTEDECNKKFEEIQQQLLQLQKQLEDYKNKIKQVESLLSSITS
ncbi:DUF2258 domain-containing protein [Sulfolobus sp. SCGC AB-777_L09]|jgi:hypothetical protein|nr:DUF2258 domain-containing protein [Sulfolobaceae archaeon]PVU70993.1 DUF2258 domain-containing protein [Sulfolobus sp. SCGC AB-777_L09]